MVVSPERTNLIFIREFPIMDYPDISNGGAFDQT
jgi:hypothetical protein